MFQQLDPIRATFQLSRLLSDSQSDREHQLRHALQHIALSVNADRAYLSLWEESKHRIRTVAQWQVEQLDPMPERCIIVDALSSLDAYFAQNRGMFALQREAVLIDHRLCGALCLEARYPIDRLSEEEQQFIKNAAQMLTPAVQEIGVSLALQDLDLLEYTQITEEAVSVEVPLEAPQVLLVEDNKINQLTIMKMMQRFGVIVHTADDGLNGISACQKQKFDLILMDLSMPNMDGFDTTREIVTSSLLNKETPIVAVTANTGKHVASRCLRLGMVEFVTKPLRLERVEELVNTYLKPTG
ncbi:response regulator [Coraliomargarita sp. SDUM461004]|uniref:Response regulator n=1 Tax=Thalassobacterium sedimentorum TaxID=3041258 RepID=A0ABU1AHJ5_9BACT|nr:response regulator [Coraliomargarita sp. SDUM461004]MDQ8194074.1 response regulator [Coraliomargarita sp. SDUM461004]